MNKGTVYYRDVPAGTLVRDTEGFTFRYDASYLNNSSLPDISATLPKRKKNIAARCYFLSSTVCLQRENRKSANAANFALTRMTILRDCWKRVRTVR